MPVAPTKLNVACHCAKHENHVWRRNSSPHPPLCDVPSIEPGRQLRCGQTRGGRPGPSSDGEDFVVGPPVGADPVVAAGAVDEPGGDLGDEEEQQHWGARKHMENGSVDGVATVAKTKVPYDCRALLSACGRTADIHATYETSGSNSSSHTSTSVSPCLNMTTRLKRKGAPIRELASLARSYLRGQATTELKRGVFGRRTVLTLDVNSGNWKLERRSSSHSDP